MADKLKVGVSVDTDGYVQGMQQAAKTTESFVQTVEEVVKETPPLRKALRDAKKESDALAYAYSQLSEEEKNSKFGQEMKAQFDIAAQKTADLIDLTGDLGERYKNLANDTRWFDTTIDGFELVANSVLGAVGAIGTFTGNTKDAQRAMSALAAVTGVLSAAQKVQQMVQKQSNVMLAIGTIQAKAKAAADKLAAKATGELTVAQRLFNTVAKANPYVLLATAIIAVIGALGTYLAMTSKSAEAEEDAAEAVDKHKEAIKSAQQTYEQTYASTLAKLLTKYTALQNEYKKLQSEYEKTEWIKTHAKELESVGLAVKSITDADKVLIDETDNVKKAFLERAQAAALYAKLQDLLTKKFEAQQEAKRKSFKVNAGDEVRGSDVERYGLVEGIDYERNPNEIGSGRYTEAGAIKASMEAQTKAMKSAGDAYQDEIDDIVNEVTSSNIEFNNAVSGKTGNTTTTPKNPNIQPVKDSIADLSKQLSDLQERAQKGALPPELQDPDKYKNKIKSLQDQIKEQKIKWGFEKPETKVQELNNKLEQAKEDYQIAVKLNDEEAKKKASETYKTIAKEIEQVSEKEQIELGLKLPDSELAKIKKKIAELEANIEYINDPVSLAATQEEIKQWKKKQEQEEIRLGYVVKPAVGSMDWFNEIVDKMQTELDSTPLVINGEINPEYIKKLKEIRDIQKQVEEAQKTPEELQAEQIEKKADAYGSYAEMLSSTANALGALGDSEAAQAAQFAMNSASMIASAIQKIAAMQAAAIAEGTESGAGLPFPANLAAIATIVSTIMSIFASLPKFADGGIMGGHSYYGDKLLARLNSKEVVINEKQQERALDLMDNSSIYNPKQKIEVVGVVRGTDVVLVAKNVIKEMKKNGKNIKIG